MVSRVVGEPVPVPNYGPGYWVHAVATWENRNSDDNLETLAAPLRIGCDVWISPNIGYISILSAHRLPSLVEPNRDPNGFSNSVIGLEKDQANRIVLLARDIYGQDTRVKCKAGLYVPGRWNRVELVLEKDGRVLPFVNGQLAIPDPLRAPKVTIDKDNPAGIRDAHAGLLVAFSNASDRLLSGGLVLNDNFRVEQFREGP